jgi:hypothetical protein
MKDKIGIIGAGKPDIKPDYILCAAIWYGGEEEPVHGPYSVSNGIVLCGHRHHQIIELYKIMTGKDTREQGVCQGFLTAENRFVSREKAADIAFIAGQIKERKHRLFSEDLY